MTDRETERRRGKKGGRDGRTGATLKKNCLCAARLRSIAIPVRGKEDNKLLHVRLKNALSYPPPLNDTHGGGGGHWAHNEVVVSRSGRYSPYEPHEETMTDNQPASHKNVILLTISREG